MRILRANVIRARASLTQLIGRIDARSRHSVKNFHFALATQGESIDDLLGITELKIITSRCHNESRVLSVKGK